MKHKKLSKSSWILSWAAVCIALTLFFFHQFMQTSVSEAQGLQEEVQLDQTTGQSVSLVYGSASGELYDDIHPLNFGSYVGGSPAETIYAETYIQFPLPALPADATVISASLELYVTIESSSGPSDFGVYNVEQDWTEVISWTTQPATNSSPVAVTTVGNVPAWYAWDISSLVQGWYAGTYSNFGLMLGSYPTPDALVNRAVRANGRMADSFRPRLLIAYELPTPTATPTSTNTPLATNTSTPVSSPTATPFPTSLPTATPPSTSSPQSTPVPPLPTSIPSVPTVAPSPTMMVIVYLPETGGLFCSPLSLLLGFAGLIGVCLGGILWHRHLHCRH